MVVRNTHFAARRPRGSRRAAAERAEAAGGRGVVPTGSKAVAEELERKTENIYFFWWGRLKQ